MRLERDVVGSVTRERPRKKKVESDRGMFGGTALGGRLRVGAERAGRGDVRASSKFSTGSDDGDGGWELGDDGIEEWPNQRKTGYGALWGDFWRLGGGVGILSGDKWRLAGLGASFDLRRSVGATLLEECMSGPERNHS